MYMSNIRFTRVHTSRVTAVVCVCEYCCPQILTGDCPMIDQIVNGIKPTMNTHAHCMPIKLQSILTDRLTT